LRHAPSWGRCTAPRVLRCRARGRQPAAAGGQWLVICVFRGQIGAPFSRRSQTAPRSPNAFRSAVFVPLEKPVTNRNSRGREIVIHFEACPAVNYAGLIPVTSASRRSFRRELCTQWLVSEPQNVVHFSILSSDFGASIAGCRRIGDPRQFTCIPLGGFGLTIAAFGRCAVPFSPAFT